MENTELTEAMENNREEEVSLRCEAGRWVGDRRTCRGELFRILLPCMEESIAEMVVLHIIALQQHFAKVGN